MLEISLIVIVLLVLILPISVHFVEKNLEAFLFFMGVLAVTFAHLWGGEPYWTMHLVREALVEPIMITVAVLVFGLLVYAFKNRITSAIVGVEHKLGSKLFCFFIITLLGIFSSVITAIMAAIILVEVISALKLDKGYETKLIVLGCFSIGLGAALTPVGEPLSTIVVAKLKGAPYNADFFFLIRHLGLFIVPGIIAIGLIGMFIEPSVREDASVATLTERESETVKDILLRSGKVYLFIMALLFLGTGFKPIIDKYIVQLSSNALYWINTVSAVMDNATLTAAEISPKMNLLQIQAVLMGLLIAGGMLIPGNIPNIIAAGKLGIRSKDWAKIGLPLGFIIMAVYFVIFLLVER
jgi:predicted cation transporter